MHKMLLVGPSPASNRAGEKTKKCNEAIQKEKSCSSCKRSYTYGYNHYKSCLYLIYVG